MGRTATVTITEDGCVPIPPEMRQELRLLPSQPVQLRVENGHLVVEPPSQEQILLEIEALAQQLRTDESLAEIWAEVEAGREDDR